MATMPNVVGLELPTAQAVLQAANVINLNTLGYFSPWPITVIWEGTPKGSSLTADSTLITADDTDITVDGLFEPHGGIWFVTAQSVPNGTSVVTNSKLSLTVVPPAVGVAYP